MTRILLFICLAWGIASIPIGIIIGMFIHLGMNDDAALRSRSAPKSDKAA